MSTIQKPKLLNRKRSTSVDQGHNSADASTLCSKDGWSDSTSDPQNALFENTLEKTNTGKNKNVLNREEACGPQKLYQRRSHHETDVTHVEGTRTTHHRSPEHHISHETNVANPKLTEHDISHESSVVNPEFPQPQKVSGRYENPEPWHESHGGTWRWFTIWESIVWALNSTLFGTNKSAVPSQAKELDKTLPIFPLNKRQMSTPPEKGIRVTWLGHSSLVVQFDGLSILTDPIFSEYAGFMRFLGVKRIRAIHGSVDDLPEIDAVVISHNHYDHLDKNTVMMLNARFGEKIHWFVPVGLCQWMRSVNCINVTELEWWAEGKLSNNPTLFVFTPAQHWTRRGLFDRNKTLWGSWSIIGQNHRFFFAGDTGYCSVFEQIGTKYGPFDLAATPIGSYEPRSLLSPQHVDPEGAVKIHLDVKAHKTIGIHWGTFILSDENYMEPSNEFKEAAKRKEVEDQCFVLSHGESKLLLNPENPNDSQDDHSPSKAPR